MGANVQVSIPVKVGGYTGQRDAWEEFESPYTLSFANGNVILTSGGYSKRQISFKLNDFNEALNMVRKPPFAYSPPYGR